MGNKPMPSEGSQQLRVTVDVLTKFSRNLVSPLRIGTGTLFPRRAISRGGERARGVLWTRVDGQEEVGKAVVVHDGDGVVSEQMVEGNELG